MSLSEMFSVTPRKHPKRSASPGAARHPSSPIPCDASASSWLGLLGSLTFANARVSSGLEQWQSFKLAFCSYLGNHTLLF